MATQSVKKKRFNQTDITLRNLRAWKKRLIALERQVKSLQAQARA